ncbi:hypothetical protein GCM10019994_00240 [Enterococcus raffinosus]|nr:hypothetical protein NUITMVRE36_35290 [Enterococcus raffinosus]
MLAPKVDKKCRSIRWIFILYGFAGAFLAVFTFLWHTYAVVTFGASMMIMSISEVLLIKSLQETITDEGRATVMSFYGLGQNVVMILFSLIYGLLAKIISIQTIYCLISGYALFGALVFFFIFSRKRIIDD